MPSIRSSARPDLRGWQPEQPAADTRDQSPPDPGTTPDPQTRSPFLHAAMPLMASTNDALSQYYSTQNLPHLRILPIRPGGSVQ